MQQRMDQQPSISKQRIKQPIIYAQSYYCSQNKISTYLCQQHNCQKIAFLCNESQCKCIQLQHQKCKDNKINLSQILNLIEQKRKYISQQTQASFQSVIDSYDRLIEKISEDRIKFLDETSMLGLSSSMRQFVNLVNEGKQSQICGELIYKINLQQSSYEVYYQPFKLTDQKEIVSYLDEIVKKLQVAAFVPSSDKQRTRLAMKKFELDQQPLMCTQLKFDSKNHKWMSVYLNCYENAKKLDMDFNRIEKIENMDKLHYLQQLRLYSNKITKIENLDSLLRLQVLNLTYNLIKKIENIGNLVRLKQLSLNGNQISKLQNLENLKSLQKLSVCMNQIIYLENIEELQSLTDFDIRKNPLCKTQKGNLLWEGLKKKGVNTFSENIPWKSQQ